MKLKMSLAVVGIAFLTACSSSDDEKLSLSADKLTMHYEETEQLTATEKVVWESEDKFVATVNANGLVEGGHVGKTNIVATSENGIAKCEIEIVPIYNTFTEPVLLQGAKTKSDVKAKEKRTLNKETSTSLVYKGGNSAEKAVVYTFDDNGKLSAAGVAISFAYTSELTDFLLERYQPVDVEDGMYVFINGNSDDFDMYVALEVESSYLMVMYVASSTIGRNVNAVEKDSLREHLNALIKDFLN